MKGFDATVRFDDGTFLNVFINSDGDLESFFYVDENHVDVQDYCDGSIYEGLSDYDAERLCVAEAIRIACEMSDTHTTYEKRPYRIVEGVDFVG